MTELWGISSIYGVKRRRQNSSGRLAKKLNLIFGFGKTLYGRTNSSAPIGENCQLRGFNKYFSSHFPIIP